MNLRLRQGIGSCACAIANALRSIRLEMVVVPLVAGLEVLSPADEKATSGFRIESAG